MRSMLRTSVHLSRSNLSWRRQKVKGQNSGKHSAGKTLHVGSSIRHGRNLRCHRDSGNERQDGLRRSSWIVWNGTVVTLTGLAWERRRSNESSGHHHAVQPFDHIASQLSGSSSLFLLPAFCVEKGTTNASSEHSHQAQALFGSFAARHSYLVDLMRTLQMQDSRHCAADDALQYTSTRKAMMLATCLWSTRSG